MIGNMAPYFHLFERKYAANNGGLCFQQKTLFMEVPVYIITLNHHKV